MAEKNIHAIVNFIWTVADDVLRDHYKKGEYPNVILPMTVLRRIDLSLENTKEEVVSTYNEYKDKIDNIEGILELKTNKKYFNYSKYNLKTLLNEPKYLKENTLEYLNSYSRNVKDIIDKFDLRNVVEKCDRDGILFALIQKFTASDLAISPNTLSNHEMGYLFEDLVRRFNEENNEEAGEHFTPREVIKLMDKLVFYPIKDKLNKIGTILIYDPACGTGGMLTESKGYLKESEEIQYDGEIYLFGQEVNDKTYATCKADFLIKGEDPNGLAFGSTLSHDGLSGKKFDFMLTNPPYGKTWKTDQDKLLVGDRKKKEIVDSRFQIGIPRVSDGQLLFVEHMLSKMKTETELGSRIASVHNGSALFTGDAGQGESDIRKYLFEHDFVEAIIALPTNMFYNTGIPTYILLLANKKEERRKGKVQLINATSSEFYTTMRKTLGQKRVEISPEQINKIYKEYESFTESEYAKVFDNNYFGYTQIKVHRPKKNEKGNIIYKKGNIPEIDKELEDIENIPLQEDINVFFENEVKRYYPDAWYDKEESKIGYEINFNKYFYKYIPPRPSEEILKELQELEKETDTILKEVVAS